MKILIVIDYYQPQMGYSETHIARELAKAGHKIAFLTSNYYFPFPNYTETSGKMLGNRELKPGVYKEKEITVYRQKLIFELFSRSYFDGHEQIITRFKPDLVISNKASGINTWKIAGLKDKYKYRLVCYDSHLPSELLREKVILKKIFYSLFRLFFSRRINSKVDKFVAVQEDTERVLKRYCGVKKPIKFIPLGTDLEKFFPDIPKGKLIRTKYGIEEDSFVIVYTGKVIPSKGVDILFSASDELFDKYKNIKLLIVGDGPQEYKDVCLNKIGGKNKNRIIWAGFQPNETLYQYYSASDVAVWPLQESTSMNDAAACALPFIANNEIGTEVRVSSSNALLYKKGDSHDLALKIESLISDKSLAYRMGQAGRRLAETKLSWSMIAPEYLQVEPGEKIMKPRVFFLNYHFIKVILDDLLEKRYQVRSNKVHIKAAVSWLKRAQDVAGDGGVSKWFSFLDGWKASYVETTGYILETFVNYYKFSKSGDIKNRAIKMGKFLLSMQLPSGGFRSQSLNESRLSQPITFDTAQDILGLISIYKLTKQKTYLNSLISAADFLCRVQEKNGSWVKYNFGNMAHSYDARVAWILLKVWELTGKNSYRESAVLALEWVVKRQQKNYWFSEANFPAPHFAEPFTHNIGYILEGILYSGILLKDKRYINIAKNTTDTLLAYFNKHKYLPGYFDDKWECRSRFTCLTGDAQISLIWLKLYNYTKDVKYLTAAKRMNQYLKTTQTVSAASDCIEGAIKGSYPLYGDILRNEGYCRMAFPNWAAKFFVDSLLEEEKLESVYEK